MQTIVQHGDSWECIDQRDQLDEQSRCGADMDIVFCLYHPEFHSPDSHSPTTSRLHRPLVQISEAKVTSWLDVVCLVLCMYRSPVDWNICHGVQGMIVEQDIQLICELWRNLLLTFQLLTCNPRPKFPNLVTKIAGESNSGFINIDTSLGTGFYILIAYSVIAGYLQYFLRTRYLKAARSSSSSEPPPAFAEDRRSSGLSQISWDAIRKRSFL